MKLKVKKKKLKKNWKKTHFFSLCQFVISSWSKSNFSGKPLWLENRTVFQLQKKLSWLEIRPNRNCPNRGVPVYKYITVDVWCRRVHPSCYKEYGRYRYRCNNMDLYSCLCIDVSSAYAYWLLTQPTCWSHRVCLTPVCYVRGLLLFNAAHITSRSSRFFRDSLKNGKIF